MTEQPKTTLLLTGDIAPQEDDLRSLLQGDAASLVGQELLAHFREADFIVGNLETVLANRNTPILKSGRALRVPSAAVKGLQALGFTAVNLANNHIFDHGASGLKCTLDALDGAEIAHFGAGMDPVSAGQPWIGGGKDFQIGILGCCEHEFSVNPHGATANGLDWRMLIPAIEDLREKCDLLIVLYHGGKEYRELPSPEEQKNCRFLIERGVDAVVCQHSHTVGAVEHWEKGVIFYGQGNFLFSMPNPMSKQGFILQFEVYGHRQWRYNMIPFERKEIGIRPLSNDEKRIWEEKQVTWTTMAASSDVVKKEWDEFCKKKQDLYLSILHGGGFLYAAFWRRTGLLKFLYPPSFAAIVRNFFMCETHREVAESILNHLMKK